MIALLDRSRLATAMLLVACAGLSGCEIRDGNETEPAENESESTLNLPSVPVPEPPMDRAALLTAVARAASATASGMDDSLDQRSLNGSRFELRIRFGCRGPAPDLSESIFGWTFDRENRTLRLRATPTISLDDRLVQKVAGEDFEAAEGFWIPRPWLLDPICPAAAAVRPAPPEAEADADTAAAQSGQTSEAPTPVEDEQESQSPPPAWPKVGIAQFFSESDPRTRQRGMRPYETVKTIGPTEAISSQGYNLVVSGRLKALPGQRAIACVTRGADSPPDCIVSARIDRVRIERPDTKEILAEWGGG